MGYFDPECGVKGERCLRDEYNSQSGCFKNRMLIGNATKVQNCCCVMEGVPDYLGGIYNNNDVYDYSNKEFADQQTKFVVFICEECFKELSLPIVDSERWEKEYEIAKEKEELEAKIAKEKKELEAKQTSLLDERKEINRQLSSIRYKLKKLNN